MFELAIPQLLIVDHWNHYFFVSDWGSMKKRNTACTFGLAWLVGWLVGWFVNWFWFNYPWLWMQLHVPTNQLHPQLWKREREREGDLTSFVHVKHCHKTESDNAFSIKIMMHVR